MSASPSPSNTDIQQKLEAFASLRNGAMATRTYLLRDLFREKGSTTVPLDLVINRLFPKHTDEEGLAFFRKWKSTLNKQVADANLEFSLVAIGNQKAPPKDRECTLEFTDKVEENFERLGKAKAREIEDEHVESYAVLEKPIISIYVCYADTNAQLKEPFLSALQTHLDRSRLFRYEVWDRSQSKIGLDPAAEIAERILNARLILRLWTLDLVPTNESPASSLELAQIQSSPACTLDIQLDTLETDGPYDLAGLDIIELLPREFPFSYSSAKQKKAAFVSSCFSDIETALQSETPDLLKSRIGEVFKKHPHHRNDLAKYADTDARPSEISDAPASPKARNSNAKPAQELLLNWACDPQSPPYFALLGELGIGKTMNSKKLTANLLERREQGDSEAPLPIYLDLRHLKKNASSEAVPKIETIIQSILDEDWKYVEGPKLLASDALRMVRTGEALIIFDGLDEKTNHLTPSEGQLFIRQLWSALPPELIAKRREAGKPIGKLLISCRSHYFRSLTDQNSLLRGEGRDGPKSKNYESMTCLPFTQEQVKRYLEKNIPAQAVERLILLIKSVHNLEELSSRPLLLNYIEELLPTLEQMAQRGEKITGITLYDLMIKKWLARDLGKHHFSERHKRMLMEELAGAMWESKERLWHVDQLEVWLENFLCSHPTLKQALGPKGESFELLQEDLRTATFLVRPDKESFRFAHTSLQEFFLASHLHRALLEKRPESWAIDLPSRETLHFLAQLIEEKQTTNSLQQLSALLSSYQAKVSELAIAYLIYAHIECFTVPRCEHIDLSGAQLQDFRFERGPSPLDLTRAIFKGAKLENALFQNALLEGSNFDQANLYRVRFEQCALENATFEQTDLVGTEFIDCELHDARLLPKEAHDTLFIRCQLEKLVSNILLDSQAIHTNCLPHTKPYPAHPPIVDLQKMHSGHQKMVNSCAFSPDGKTIASATDDNTVRIWDTKSAKLIATLEGHQSMVTSCAFSPDGKTIASAAADKTVRIWDAKSAKLIATLEGHKSAVNSCAFSPDGKTIASAAWDNTVRIWDAKSAKLIATLEGHEDRVTSCAFSPDGRTIASAARDSTVRIWDVRSAKELRSILLYPDHEYAVFDTVEQKIIHASRNTWPYLGYTIYDETLQRLRYYPAETFGPLPVNE